jgi:hypothetical protein
MPENPLDSPEPCPRLLALEEQEAIFETDPELKWANRPKGRDAKLQGLGR